MQFAILVRPEPCDVIADDGRFPTLILIRLRRNQHREVRLAAGRGKGGGEISFFATGFFHSDDEHVLGHPFVFACNVGSDAQREAFFPEQRIAAVARAVGHDLAGLGEMDDVFVLIARPCGVLLTGRERCTNRMQAGNEVAMAVAFFGNASGILILEALEHLAAHVRHDAHVHDHIGAVADLDADLCQWRVERAHAERDHIHRAALHRAIELFAQRCAHLGWIGPVIGGTCLIGAF